MKPWTAQPDSISSGTLLEEKTYFSNSGSNVSVPCCSWPFFSERHQGIKLKSLRKACIFFSSFLVHPLPNILLKSSVTNSKCWFQFEEHSDLNWDESSLLRKKKKEEMKEGREGGREKGREKKRGRWGGWLMQSDYRVAVCDGLKKKFVSKTLKT